MARVRCHRDAAGQDSRNCIEGAAPCTYRGHGRGGGTLGAIGGLGSPDVSEPAAPAPRDPLVYWALAALLALVWLATLGTRPLFNPDEGRYAEIPREMLSGGDWVIPHLNGLAYIEKPPLQYWATAVSFSLLGPSEFAARLYSALTAAGTVFLVWLTARRLWNRDASWRAA